MENLVDILFEAVPTADRSMLLDVFPGHQLLAAGGSYVESNSLELLSTVQSSFHFPDRDPHGEVRNLSLEQIEEIQNSTVTKLDGFAILGTTWKIVKNNAQTTVLGWTSVIQQSKLFLKGMKEISDPKFRYEIQLTTVDNAVLSLIITANTNTCNKQGIRRRIIYSEIVSTLKKLLVEVIKTSPRSSETRSLLVQLDSVDRITIMSNDWDDIGDRFAQRLNSLNSEDKQIFPTACKFWFACYQFGQDAEIDTISKQKEHYPHINPGHAFRAVIHIAFDQCLANNFLWFTKDWMFDKLLIPGGPTFSYNVGLLKDTGNFTYSNLPANAEGVDAIHLYTRVFQSIHKNAEGFFGKPQITKLFLKLYMMKLNGKKPQWSKVLKCLLDGKLERMKNGIIQVLQSHQTVTSRIEFVWSTMEANFDGMKGMIMNAAATVQTFALQHDFLEGSTYIATPSNDIINKFIRILTALFGTIENIRKRIVFVIGAKQIYDDDVMDELLTTHDFARLYLSEALLKRFFRGTFHDFENSEKKGRLILDSVIAQTSFAGTLLPWPFTDDVCLETESQIMTNLPVFQLFPKVFYGILSEAFHDTILQNVLEDYKDLLSSNPSQCKVQVFAEKNEKFYNSLSTAILKYCLIVNGLSTTEENILQLLWELGTHDRFYKGVQITYKVQPVTYIYKQFAEMNSSKVAGFAGLRMFLQYIRDRNQQHQKGGTQLSLAVSFENQIIKAKVPLCLEIRNTQERVVFVPYYFDTFNQNILNVYVKAFKRLFGRETGALMVNVRVYFNPLLRYISGLKNKDKRPPRFQDLFDITNRLLDNGDVKLENIFKKQPKGIKSVFENVEISERDVLPISSNNEGMESTDSLEVRIEAVVADALGAEAEGPDNIATRSHHSRDSAQDILQEVQDMDIAPQSFSSRGDQNFGTLPLASAQSQNSQAAAHMEVENADNFLPRPSLVESENGNFPVMPNRSHHSQGEGRMHVSDKENSLPGPSLHDAEGQANFVLTPDCGSQSLTDFRIDDEVDAELDSTQLELPSSAPLCNRFTGLNTDSLIEDDSHCESIPSLGLTNQNEQVNDNMPRITDHGPAQNQLYAAEEESVTYEIHGQVGYEESITEYNGFEEDAASVTSNVPSSQFTTSDMPYNKDSVRLNTPRLEEVKVETWKTDLCTKDTDNSSSSINIQVQHRTEQRSHSDRITERNQLSGSRKSEYARNHGLNVTINKQIAKRKPSFAPRGDNFSPSETQKIFVFMQNHDVMKYMKGYKISALIADLNVCGKPRTFGAINTRIKTVAKMSDECMTTIIGDKLCAAVRKALREIEKASQAQTKLVLPDHIVNRILRQH